RQWCSCGRGPCAAAPTDTGTSTGNRTCPGSRPRVPRRPCSRPSKPARPARRRPARIVLASGKAGFSVIYEARQITRIGALTQEVLLTQARVGAPLRVTVVHVGQSAGVRDFFPVQDAIAEQP